MSLSRTDPINFTNVLPRFYIEGVTTCRKFIHPMFVIYSSKVWSATQPVLRVGNKQIAEHAKLNIQFNVYQSVFNVQFA